MLSQEPDPTTILGRAALRARLVPAIARVPIVLVPFVLTAVFAVTESGPYWFFAAVQASFMDGEHFLFVSGGLTLIVVMFPFAAVIQLWGHRIEQQRLAPKPMGSFPQPGGYYHTPYPPQAGGAPPGQGGYGAPRQGPYYGSPGAYSPQQYNPYSNAQPGPGAHAAPGHSAQAPYPPSGGPSQSG